MVSGRYSTSPLLQYSISWTIGPKVKFQLFEVCFLLTTVNLLTVYLFTMFPALPEPPGEISGPGRSVPA
jgi:hypothetical protein